MSRTCPIRFFPCREFALSISAGVLLIGAMATAQVRNEYSTPSASDADSNTVQVLGSQRIHVKWSATGLNNGTSWANAYTHMHDALAAASGDEIWVAAGIYKPDRGVGITPGDRTATFQLESGVALYAGFAGTETLLSQRNPALHTTILSGDLNGNDAPVACTQNAPDCDSFGTLCVNGFCIIKSNNSENSHHVVTGSGTDATAVLDGFSITAGNANVVEAQAGAGMNNVAGSPTVNDCTFRGNSAFAGSGIFNGSGSVPRVTNCMFRGNSSDAGGAMHNNSSSPSVIKCTFDGNASQFGGGMQNFNGSSPNVINSIFSGNLASDSGGAVYNSSGSPKLFNCFFGGNSADLGGAISNAGNANLSITNCAFTNNSAQTNGGAIHHVGQSVGIFNSTLFSNTAVTFGGGVYVQGLGPSMTNSIFWFNSDSNGMTSGAQIKNVGAGFPIFYNIVQGGATGSGSSNNINVDPRFFDPDGADNILGTMDDDLRLRTGSPAIDSGNNAMVSADTLDLDGDLNVAEPIPFDLAGNTRMVGGTVDRGTFEYFPDCNNNGIDDATDIDDVVSADCNSTGWPTNDIPDECDIAACSGNPGCDDCNLNGIPDGCDIHPNFTVGPKITASDATAGDSFAGSVSVSGNTAVVGASTEDNAGGADAGSAYVFTNSGGVWTQQQKLTASDAAVGDEFGYSVSVSGNTAVVGAYLNDDAGNGSGSAYVFTRNGTVWTQQQKLTALDAAAFDQFGISVAISGDTVVVGAYGNDDVGSASGSAYVFTRSGTVWSQQQKLTASDAAAGDEFGLSVSVSGDTAVVGAWFDDGAGTDSGSAYVFVRSGTVWTQQQKLTASDAAADDWFGSSVSASGDLAIVGSPFNDSPNADAGAAYVFARSGSVWTQQPKLIAADAAVSDFFGTSVSINGGTAVIGARLDDDGGDASGSAYVYVRSGVVWTQQEKLTALDAEAGDRFGYSVSVNGDTVLIGAALGDAVSNDTGSAYMFDIPNFDSNGNGIPDECARFADACTVPGEDDFWTCGGNWPTLGGVDYPDDVDSAVGISARLPTVPMLRYSDPRFANPEAQASWRASQGGGSADVFLNQTVEIPTLDIEPGSQLRITQTGAEGDLNFSSPGVLHSRGTIVMSGARAIGAAGILPIVTLGPGSLYQAADGAFGVSASMSASLISVVGNDCFIPPCPHGGEVTLTESMSLTTTGNLTIDGSLANGLCELQRQRAAPQSGARETAPPAIMSFHTPPSIRVIGPNTGISVGAVFSMQGAAGFRLESLVPMQVGGDWDNQSVRPDCFDSAAGTIRMDGTNPQNFEAAAIDSGGAGGSSNDFRIGTLEIAANSDLTLRDLFDNDLQGQASCGEAQYVGTLVLEAGSTITIQNCRLYYDSLVKDPSAQIIQMGCGEARLADNPASALADPTGLSKSRAISFVPPPAAVAGGSTVSAIRVTLASLHRVTPPYTGGPSVPFTLFEGQVRWVGPPATFVESAASGTPFQASVLQCSPYYHDWSTINLLHVFGSAIVPSSSYRVQFLAGTCLGIEDRCTAISTALVVNTTRWGDVETPYNPPSATVQPDVGDIGALVNKFRSAPSAPIKARALLAGNDAFGNITTLNVDLGFGHIAACVDAFRGQPYPFTISTCP